MAATELQELNPQLAKYAIDGFQLQQAFKYKERQEMLARNPVFELENDYKRIYHDGNYMVGFPDDIAGVFNYFAKKNTYVVVGAQLGDEGKGRIVDNILEHLVDRIGLKKVYVTRFQGGSNAGHTSKVGDITLKQHQIPSLGLAREEIQLVGIMDSGMNLNPADLKVEHDYIAELTGKKLETKLVISGNAVLNTDLDRAEEVLLDKIAGRKSGSTSEGMRTSSGHYYERTSLNYNDFMRDDWEEVLSKRYDDLAFEFSARYGENLADVNVPDYDTVAAREIDTERGLREEEEGIRKRPARPIGTKKDFLERLGKAREWIIENKMVQDTAYVNWQAVEDIEKGVAGHIFETAQSVGLNPLIGTIGIDKDTRDTTSTDTTPNGVLTGTKVIKADGIEYKMGIFKATYMSSVGNRQMMTEVTLDESVRKPGDLKNGSKEEYWAAWIRNEAQEFGTTTGRPRDICFLDLPFLTYNCFAANLNMLAATHLDIARPNEKIKVCTHYLKKGKVIPYTPGLEADPDVIPQYLELDGWDGNEVKKAKTFDELPENAKRAMAFIQARTGIPLVFSTTGPKREQHIKVPQVQIERPLEIARLEKATGYKQEGIIFPN